MSNGRIRDKYKYKYKYKYRGGREGTSSLKCRFTHNICIVANVRRAERKKN